MSESGTSMFTDLSGPTTATFDNPYDAMLEGCNQDPQQIQQRYKTHRETRNEQQKAKLLSHTFAGFSIDPILDKLRHDPSYIDPRNCLVFWARPPSRIRSLVNEIQQRLLRVAPTLWLMPLENLHLTAMEITHSRTPGEITSLKDKMGSSIPGICDYPFSHRARLVKPALGFDSAAIALTFLPAAGEPGSPADHQDSYTYHQFRRDLYGMCVQAGVEVESRYVLPSAHLTIARFVNQDLHEGGRVGELVKVIEGVNKWLRDETWRSEMAGEWVVGERKGLVCRMMRVWYGDGESVYEGKGFEELREGEGG